MSWITRVKATTRALWRPFPTFKLLPQHVFSPLDAEAEAHAYVWSERALQDNPAADRMFAAFVRFLDDPNAALAVRKEYLITYEKRLRAVALAAGGVDETVIGSLDWGRLGHSIDAAAAADLAAIAPVPAIGSRLGAAWRVLLVHAMALPVIAALIALRHGRRRVVPRTCRVALPDSLSAATLLAVAQVAGSQRCWDETFSMVVVATTPQLARGMLPNVDPARFDVPLGPWLRCVLAPSLRLSLQILGAALVRPRDPRLVELATAALRLGVQSLDVWRLAFNLRPRWMLSFTESSALHNLQSCILGHFGTGLVRWPNMEMETPGYVFRHLDYALFLAGGGYHQATFGESWAPRGRAQGVGQIRNDLRIENQLDIDETAPRRAIEAHLAAGRRMAVYFAANELCGFDQVSLDLLATVWALLRDRDDWFLVIKPKKPLGAGGFFGRLSSHPGLRDLLDSPRVVVTNFPGDSTKQATPPLWLAERMGFGVTVPSSVQVEAVVHGARVLAYFPYFNITPAKRVLMDSDLYFNSLPALSAAVAKIVDGQPLPDLPIAFMRENFDPDDDGRALDRLVRQLFADDGGS